MTERPKNRPLRQRVLDQEQVLREAKDRTFECQANVRAAEIQLAQRYGQLWLGFVHSPP